MERTILTRRTLLGTTLATSALAAPSVRVVHAAGSDACGGMVLAWHTNIAPRWLDPQQHDGGAAPDNFLSAVHDALLRVCRRREERQLSAALGRQIPRRHSDHTGRQRHACPQLRQEWLSFRHLDSVKGLVYAAARQGDDGGTWRPGGRSAVAPFLDECGRPTHRRREMGRLSLGRHPAQRVAVAGPGSAWRSTWERPS